MIEKLKKERPLKLAKMEGSWDIDPNAPKEEPEVKIVEIKKEIIYPEIVLKEIES